MEEIIGKICVVRSNMAGVFIGKIDKINDDKSLLMSNVRKIYYWKGANTIEDIAEKGIKNINESKITLTIDTLLLSEFIQIIPASEIAIANIKSHPIWTIK